MCRRKRRQDPQGTFGMFAATSCSFLYSVTTEVRAYGKWLRFVPYPHLQKQIFHGWRQITLLYLTLQAPVIANLPLPALSHDGCCQDLCSQCVGDADCFTLVGSSIFCPQVVQNRHLYIPMYIRPSQSKIFFLLCELHWLFLLPSHQLGSWWGTTFSMLFPCHHPRLREEVSKVWKKDGLSRAPVMP